MSYVKIINLNGFTRVFSNVRKTTDLTILYVTICQADQFDRWFEKILSLAIDSDTIIALTYETDEPKPNFHRITPESMEFIQNLKGIFHPIGIRFINFF